MNYLVMKAQETANEYGLPDEWPVVANPYKDGDKVPSGYQVMTQVELESLKASNMAAYESWKQQEDTKKKKRREDEKKEKDAPKKTAQSKLQILGFTDDEIKEIMGTSYFER